MSLDKSNFVCRRLVGRVAIVTGGAHGIGKAYARRLADEGAHVVIADIDGAAAETTAAALTALAGAPKALGLRVDVSSEESLADMVAKTMEAFGRIDILINNAAIFATIPMSRLPFDEIRVDEWDRMMNVNLKGSWLAVRAVAPVMKQQKSGKIINIASGTAFKGTGGRIHYVTSKAGMIGLTKSLANDLGPHNVNVNCLAPGSTLSEENATDEILQMRQKKGSTRPLSRTQLPEDLVGAMAFFCSSDSDFITGQTLVVDGGTYMH
ncbi:MAG: dehydrogenase [Acidocella sp. 20-57-95]|nr:MAG: dehydrogenase [Acidocella sp. 20-57-95]HQT64002.1 glucose 1-dehydrogenase [Acidocella sp.]